jgi:hypothetical protein
LFGSLGSSCWSEIFSRLGCSSRPNTNIFFLTGHYFLLFVPIAQLAGQAVVPRRLSLSLSGSNEVITSVGGSKNIPLTAEGIIRRMYSYIPPEC